MKKFKTKTKKIVITKLILIPIFLFLFFISVYLFTCYGKKYSEKLEDVIIHKMEKVTYQFFSDYITNDIIDNDVSDILIINKNSDGEIIFISYDMEKSYKLLTDVSVLLKDKLKEFEKSDLKFDDPYLYKDKYGMYINIPLLFYSDNIFLNKVGPKIKVYFNFTSSLLTNVKTKVSDYGLNNALVEMYINVKINEYLLTPIKDKNVELEYDILINSFIVNGKLIDMYKDGYKIDSNIIRVK